jgi:hybrid cluster-associated redox disulfide protein
MESSIIEKNPVLSENILKFSGQKPHMVPDYNPLFYYFRRKFMADQISKEMTFGELIRKFPKAGPILAGYGLHCIGCHIATVETIEQGSKAHGLAEEEIKQMVRELNNLAV